VTEPRDEIDSWLGADVEPLAPPPGAFGRISKRARRRKASRALASAAGAVILIAAAVALPQAVTTLLHGGTGPAQGPAMAQPVPSKRVPGPGQSHPTGGGGTPASHKATFAPSATSALSAGGSGIAPPPNFQPTSVTFGSLRVGAVLGQAGTPGQCATQYCTSLAGTSDYGTTWYGVSAPVTGPPVGATGVSQLRFLDLQDGWAFGPELWVTHDGGAHWKQEQTFGLRVTSLETAGSRAFALFASCTGNTAAYAAHCDNFSLYSSAAASDQWFPVPGPAGGLKLSGAGLGHPASASLLLLGGPAGGTGYVLAPGGLVYSGPLTGAAWSPAGLAPMAPGAPGPGGQPTSGLLAAGSGQLFELTTTTATAGGSQDKAVYSSANGGKNWHQVGSAPVTGIARSLAAAQGNLVVLATTTGIDVSTDGGASWTLAETGPPHAAAGREGFSYVGMTSQAQGVAVPADPHLHEVFITTNGGVSWQARPIQP
jgi:hypothetical protein